VISPTPEILNQESAYALIANWQKVKSKVLGRNYEVSALETVLTEPILSQWRRSSESLKEENAYYEYELKELKIQEVEIIDQFSAKVTAQITESRTLIRQGEQVPSESTPHASYRVRYDLVKQNQQWLIRDMSEE
jgi:ribonucleotide reductase alpha subunit